MKEIVVKKCKLGSFFKRRQSLKIGVEGSRMHDILVSQSDNNLACFYDEGTKNTVFCILPVSYRFSF